MVSSVFGLYKLSIALVLTILVPLLSFFALKLLTSGFSSPEKRSHLKEALSGFVIFLFSIPLAYLAYSTLVKLSSLASKYLLGESFAITNLSNFSSTLLSILSSETLIGTYNLGTLFAMLTISIQRILLVLGAVTLPFSLALLFLTSSSSLKQLGQALLMFFGMVIFMPLIDSLIFQCAELAILGAESAEFIVVGSYWLVGLVNLLVFFAAFSVSKTGSGVTLIRNIVKKN
jgi:hypothetical protein|tara:strand:+ start:545 stop:1237 length:693 start_codon:yes stop_codon:yes gene_type:complete